MKLLNKEIDKRITVKLDKTIRSSTTSGTMTYGAKNDYPQVIEKLIFGSQTAKACWGIYSKFIAGDGFEKEQIGQVKVGKDSRGKDLTLDDIRRKMAASLAMFNGCYLHVNVNLDGEVDNISVIPFKHCRLSKKDDNGYCAQIGVYDNWTKEVEGKSFDKNKITWFDNFNVEEKALMKFAENAGGMDKYKGQVFSLYFDDNYLYPLSPFDSVYLDCDTEYQIQLFKNREIRNGFSDKIILRRSPCLDEKDETATQNKIKDWMGPDGDKLLMFEDEFDENGEVIKTSGFAVDKIQTNINDKLFADWEKSLANNIRKAIKALPAVLIDYEQGKLSTTSGETIIEATNYYNALTSGDRDILSQALKTVFSHHPDLKNTQDWTLKNVSLVKQPVTPIQG